MTTRNDDIERVLEQWFTEGPQHMSDRLFDGTLERIERLPKRRFADLQLRLSAMNRHLRLAAAAAVIIVVAGAGLAVVKLNSDVGATPSPSPTAHAESALPAALQATWLSVGTRIVPSLNQPTSETMVVSVNRVSLPTWDEEVVSSAAIAGDRLIVRLESGLGPNGKRFPNSDPPCLAQAEGTYRWNLSPGGMRLSLRLVADGCAARAGMLAGEWIHTTCADGGQCIGNLEAGKYESTAFQPFQFDYSVPAGWVNPHDNYYSYTLQPTGSEPGDGIYLYSNVFQDAQAQDCTAGTALPQGQPGAKALAAWLGTLPGLTTTSPVPLTLGGLKGVRIDVSVNAGGNPSCTGGDGEPLVNIFTAQQSDESITRISLLGEARARYILLDYLGSTGRVVGTILIDIESSTAADYATLLSAAEPVVATFRFTNESRAAQ